MSGTRPVVYADAVAPLRDRTREALADDELHDNLATAGASWAAGRARMGSEHPFAQMRERGRAILVRAIDRGEVAPDIDMELALDLLAAPIYWRLLVRDGSLEPGYLDGLTEMLVRALGK